MVVPGVLPTQSGRYRLYPRAPTDHAYSDIPVRLRGTTRSSYSQTKNTASVWVPADAWI